MQVSSRLRSVEVARGRTGYGFTLSGQSPCVISSVIKESPAEFVGLKPGDQICVVNEIHVKNASHEDVVKLIGKCSGILHMVIAEVIRHIDSCSSDEELAFYEGKTCLKQRPDSKALGINRAKRVVEEMQSGGIFNMIFENPSASAAKCDTRAPKQRSRSMSASHYEMRREKANKVDLLSKEEISKVLSNDCLFSNGIDNLEDFELDASILNVGMVVGYLGSIELPSTSSNLEYDSLQAIRGCMRRLRAEQKIHSLVLMKIMHDSIQLCTDKNGAIAVYPAEKLAFSAVCPDDRRFFGLVTMQCPDDQSLADEEGILRTSCHVFMVDPELFHHKIHQGISRRFGFECTPDPDTNGCLEFPTSSLPVLQFISVLYRDMGELIEGMRARAFLDNEADAHQNNSTSSNSDSGIGNFNQEEKPNRVLVVDLGTAPSKHIPHALREAPGGRGQSHQAALHWNDYCNEEDRHFSLHGANADKQQNVKKHLGPSASIEVPVVPTRGAAPSSKKATTLDGGGQRWLPVHVIQDWQHGNISDQESYADSTDGWSSINCGTLPPPMNKIPADRYRVEGNFGQPPPVTRKVESWSKKVFDVHNKFGASNNCAKTREDKKSLKPSHLVQAPHRSSGRRSFGRSKRFSITRSLDDFEAATVSDGELNSTDLKGCISDNSLSSNASLPSVQSCRRLGERRVASWAVSFERLLQDPVGVRYFTEFLKKEFSEENILFWQSCEYFSRIPVHDKNELSYRAREIFNKFLSNKATTPVNIDSQAHLADDVLNAPHPDMFKEQQLQIFNLMKFDSYTRFLKSRLYQECMLAEVEGRALPDPQEIPSSPTSKHSISSERSNISTPKKQLSRKTRSGRSLNEESGGEDENERKKKGAFFSWSRSKSIGKSQRKRENGDISNDCSHTNGGNIRRRGSQGSVSSSASLELINCGSNGNALELESSRVQEREKSSKQCYISLPDGSSSAMLVKPGLSIKDMLSGLCEKHGFNIAAVDLFLIGGNKPLVLSQDSSILESRDLRIEKRTLFRLDLVPINRSVGLKAKPTKPVTEVLRPVVAKYGLNLSELVARLSGEHEPLDLGLPISNLDGQRVVLEEKENLRGKEKQKPPVLKTSPTVISGPRSPTSAGEDRPLVKSASIRMKRENGKGSRDVRLLNKDEPVVRTGRKRQQKINLDEAEAFFEMISKAQSNRAEDQRGLLRKEDLVLPDFLRLTPGESASSRPTASNSNNKRTGRKDGEDKAAPSSRAMNGTRLETPPKCTDRPLKGGLDNRDRADFSQAGSRKPYLPFNAPLSPIPHVQERNKPGKEKQSRDLPLDTIQTIEDENEEDLTLVAEGDISSPNSTLLPPPPSPPCDLSKLSEANYSPPPSFMGSQDNSGYQRSGRPRKKETRSKSIESFWVQTPVSAKGSTSLQPADRHNQSRHGLPARGIIDVDGVKQESRRQSARENLAANLSFEGYISELKSYQGRMRSGVYRRSDLPSTVTAKGDRNKGSDGGFKATFV